MPLTIGQVALAVDVNVQTVRYYERRGLLAAPQRTVSGYRQYPEDTIGRLRFIRHAKGLGFALREIQELLELRVSRRTACDAVERKTREKIELVEQKIYDLRRINRTLGHLAAACAARRPTDDCPILGALEEHDESDN